VKQELKDGKSHSYRVALIKEQYLHVVVEQQGIDVAVDLSGPGGKDIGKVDDTIDTQGKEEAYIVAEEPGEYLMNVIAVNKTARKRSGMYEIKIEEMRAATSQDRNRYEALIKYTEGLNLYRQGGEESLRKAKSKFEESLLLNEVVSNRRGEATVLN